nr:YvrJ family protein [Oxobacter pfennigii]
MPEMVSLISNLGFPIAISVFLLIRIEGKIEKLTLSINDLSSVISAMNAATKM